MGTPARDCSHHPFFVWWLTPAGSIQCLAPALAEAPDQDQQRAAKLPGLPQMFLGPVR